MCLMFTHIELGAMCKGYWGLTQPKSAGPPQPRQIVLNPITAATLFPSYQAPCSFSLIFQIYGRALCIIVY